MEPEDSATPDPLREEPAKKRQRTPANVSATPTSPKMHQLIAEYKASHPEIDDGKSGQDD